MEKITSFSTRGFVSILMALCFFGLAFSGIVMYVAPPCSVAEIISWTVLGMSKVQWSSIHMVSALTILVLAVIHLFVYNWKTMMCYIKRRRTGQRKVCRELLWAVILALVLYTGAALLIPPFGLLEEGNEVIKEQYRELVRPIRDHGPGW